MANPNNRGRKNMPKIPRSIVVIYILMIIVLLGLCAGVFIVLFSNVSDDSKNSSSTSSFSMIDTSSGSVSSGSVSSTSSSTDIVFTSSTSTESSSDSGTESSQSSTESSSTSSEIYWSETFDLSFFEDDLFIGDSIFTGLYLYPGYLDMSQVAAAVGMTPYGAMTKTLDDKGMTAVEYAAQKQPKRIFIMLGSNAMSGSHSGLESSYRELVEKLIDVCPDADICCISVTPTARVTDYPNIDNSEVREVNRYIKSMCSELGLKYCDLYSIISDDDGYFLEDFAEIDGMHFKGRTYAVLLSELQRIM